MEIELRIREADGPVPCFDRHRQPNTGGEALRARRLMLELDLGIARLLQARNQLMWRAELQYLAFIQDANAIAQRFGFLHVMRGEQHGASVPFQLPHDIPQATSRLRVE